MKTVWITGASSGIGLALTQYYATQGWQVVATARQEKPLLALNQQHANVSVFAADVTSTELNTDQLAAHASSIDVVIANAGTADYVDINAFDAEVFQRLFDLNVVGAMRTVEAALPLMTSPSQIALVSSLAPELPFTRAQAYAGTKAALDCIAKGLQTDLQGKGIDINLIKPGFVKTPLTDKNTFPMPWMISADDAAKRIAKAIDNNVAVLRFPTRLSLVLRVAKCLPSRWLSKQLARQTS